MVTPFGNGKKTPLQSKKFVAFLIQVLLGKALALAILFLVPAGTHQTILLTAIITFTGFNAVGYIQGQAGLDKVIQVVATNAQAGLGTLLKGMSTTPNNNGQKPAPVTEALTKGSDPKNET